MTTVPSLPVAAFRSTSGLTACLHSIRACLAQNNRLDNRALTRLLALQVATALIKLDASKSLAMAVVPMGTANDFATSLGLPEDPWEALQLCVLDTAHPIDVGQVNDKVYVYTVRVCAVIDLLQQFQPLVLQNRTSNESTPTPPDLSWLTDRK